MFFINTIIISIKLFSNQITDFTDVTLVSKAISRNKIFFTKTLISFAFLFTSFFIQSIFSIIITSIFYVDSYEILSYWLITFFGQMIVSLIIVPIIFYFNFTFSKIIALTSSIILLTIFLLTSFISHFVFPNSSLNNELINNNNYRMSYSKLISIDSQGNQTGQQLVVRQNISNSKINDNTNYKDNLDNVSIASNFMPGEWLMTPFQAMYMASDYSNDLAKVAQNAVSKYKFGIVRFYNESIVSINDLKSNSYYLPIRVEDQSVFDLNQYDLVNLLVNNIQDVINSKNNTIDFSSNIQIENFLSKINNQNLVWDQIFSQIEINTISEMVGLTGRNPSLYYAFKYHDILSKKLNGLYEEISLKISKTISNIYKGIFSNYQAYMAILYNNNYTNNFLDNKYPSIDVYNDAIAPAQQDLDYFKNILITWSLNSPSLLLTDKTRKIIDLSNLSFQGQTYNITDKNQWISFIDKNATSLINLKNIYSSLSSIALASTAQISSVNYAPNYFDLNQYSYAMNVRQQTWIDNAYIYMIFIVLISIIVNIYIYKIYCNKNF